MADKEQVIQGLRATLISVKGALTVRQCNRDYKELQGEWIPFRKLGYSTLQELFSDVPGFKISERNGEWYVDAIASQETQHIAAMVSRQRTAKKTSFKFHHPNRFPRNQGSWRKPFSSHSSSYNYNNQYSNQYYRANGGSPFNNNKYAYSNKYSKPVRSETPPTTDHTEKTTNNSETKSNNSTLRPEREVSIRTEQTARGVESGRSLPQSTVTKQNNYKHSGRSEPKVKSSSKVSATARLLTLRDRLSTVDLIPLQLPAASNECVLLETSCSAPVTHVAPAGLRHDLEPPPDTTSSVVKLEWTCRKLGLPLPVYKVHDIRPKRGLVSYASGCKVGSTHFATSYPDTAPTEELAREMVALKLLAMIESSEADGVRTSSNDKAVSCLADLVSEHESGLWATIVPKMYRDKFGENLPSNWLELIENCPRIYVDQLVNGLVLLPNNEDAPLPLLEMSLFMDDTIDFDLPPLQFPDDRYWNVYVTVAVSTIEIWLRIVGPEYEISCNLLNDMAEYYGTHGTTVDTDMIITNAWYAVKLEEGDWQRAKILEIDGEIASVFLGDHGEDDFVSVDNIRILEPQFRILPAQAILCRLEGAEELVTSEIGVELVRQRLPGEVLVAEPGRRADPDDPSVAVVLYDTKTTRDVNLNQDIVRDFCIAAAFTVTQNPCEVEVGYVTDEGFVWVTRVGGPALVRNALAMLTSPDGPYRRQLPAAPLVAVPGSGTLYIMPTHDGDWVRCTIITDLDSEGMVRTLLVDSGHVRRAPLSSLVPLQPFSPALNDFPKQAISVRLGNAAGAAAGMVPRLREMLLGACVLCRALPAGSSAPAGAPNVELFVRTGPQNILASVNNAILLEYKYLNKGKVKEEQEKVVTDHVEALNRKKERIFRSVSSSGSLGEERTPAPPPAAPPVSLPPPVLPEPGGYIDVTIAMAANPWNFVVQLHGTKKTLLTMATTLQTECPKLSELDAPTNPVSGELYTVYYDKYDAWYRVTVAGSVSAEMVSVYFCDYGDLALFPSKALRPVPITAPLARSLPPQAIKARLYNVTPLHQDWSVEDCIRFQAMCVEQQFVGMCMEVGKDPLNPSEPLLTLDLIDTSTDEDIYLNKQLVSEGRALLESAS